MSKTRNVVVLSTGSDTPTVAYATVDPLTMLLSNLCAPVLALVLIQ